MYIFNPEHDLCMANGDIHFVPPESALAFGRDCADIIKFFKGLDSLADTDGPMINKIVPWGWNSVLCNRLRKQGYAEELLPDDHTLKNIVALSHRSVALDALEYMGKLPEFIHNCMDGQNSLSEKPLQMLEAGYRIAATSLRQVEEFLHQNKNVVLKAPLSGSGKGVRFVSEYLSHSDFGWCSNLIAKHGYVVVERRYRPVMEFAMLFRCSDLTPANGAVASDGVEFVGYSLFYTQNGAYRGNILGSNEFIKGEICKYVPEWMLDKVKDRLMAFLKERVYGKYQGYIGVDQFVCSSYPAAQASGAAAQENLWFNPVVEINLRMTMGLVARNIYDRFAGEYNLQDGMSRFEICRNKPSEGGYSHRIVK